MFYGRGRGFGRGGGRGFGFRGSSPPWPFVGLGRGGLPRGAYFTGGAGWAPGALPYPPPAPGYDVTQSAYPPQAPQMSREQELDFLKNEAEGIKGQLGQIETRMNDLESGE